MKLPVIQGVIRRRLLVNFRVDPAVMRRQLPDRFRPKLQNGHAVSGICLIRLEQVRPRHVPAAVGLNSENAAHRTAVLWTDDDGSEREGVFISRRDTGSVLNHLAGGRLFPGEHHRATFEVTDDGTRVDLRMRSDDDAVQVSVRGHATDAFPKTSCFGTLETASSFFAGGAVGYSVTSEANRLDGLRLETARWLVQPFAVEHVASSYMSDEKFFPRGSVEFDCALLMRDIAHEWHEEADLYV